MKDLGFGGWSRVTVSDIERGIRSTGVDELFALAVIFKTYVVKLIDPGFAGDQNTGVDLGTPYPDQEDPLQVREIILDEKAPWQLERRPEVSFEYFRERWLERFPPDREEDS